VHDSPQYETRSVGSHMSESVPTQLNDGGRVALSIILTITQILSRCDRVNTV